MTLRCLVVYCIRLTLLLSFALLLLRIVQPEPISGQVEQFRMFGMVSTGDGTTASFPPHLGAGFVGQEGCSGTFTGFFETGDGSYDTGEAIPGGCVGYASTQPAGYFQERIDNVAITGNTQVDFTIYSEWAWLSGSVSDAITGGAPSNSPPSVKAFDLACDFQPEQPANMNGASYDFGGIPGFPSADQHGLRVCRPGVFSGPGQHTFRIVADAGIDYFDETRSITLHSGNIVSGFNFAIYPQQGNIKGTIRDAVTGAPVSVCVLALPNASANCSNGNYTFAGAGEPPDWGLLVNREGDTGPGSKDFTLKVTATGYSNYVSGPVHVTSGQSTIHDIYLYPLGFNPDLGPCDKDHCEHNAGSPINLTNGNVWVQQRDYSLPGLAGGLELVRTWNSLWRLTGNNIETVGMFGDSWRSTYEERLNTLGSNLRYWRSDGSSWLFAFDSVTQSYNVISPPNERAWIQFDSNTGVYALTFLDGNRRTFKQVGSGSNAGIRLTGIIDRNGNQATVTHASNNGRINQVTDASGRVLTFNYPNSSAKQVSSLSDATGVIATYTYSSNRLARVTYADNTFVTFSYDFFSRLLSILDINGKVVEAHTYDAGNRGLTSERAGGVDRITVAYQDGLTSLTDSRSNSSQYRHGQIGGRRFIFSVAGSGCSSCGGRGNSVFSYDTKGNRTSSTDALGRATAMTYDIWGNLTSRSVQLDATTTLTWTYTYNAFGQVLTATDPAGNLTTNVYDAAGNLVSTTQSGVTTSFGYDVKGQLTTVTDPRSNSTTFTYTPAGLLATVTDALTNTTTYTYSPRGNRLTATDALNNTTTFNYNIMNRLTQVLYPDQSTTGFGYDYRGRRTSVTDANNRVTSFAYDDADRLTSVTDADNNVTAYAYDTENNLTSITDALGRVTSFAYDAEGRVTSTTFPSTLQETYTYDDVGNLLSKTDRKGQTLSYTYDALNRLTRKQYPDATGADYTYDNLSRLTQVVDPTGTYEFDYDSLGRLLEARTTYVFWAQRTFTIGYTYDAAGNRLTMTNPDNGVTNYEYDELNRLTSLTNPEQQQFTFSYDALGRRTGLNRPNGVNTAYSYDDLSRLLSVLHQLGGNTLDGATYTLDPVGNRTAKTDHLSSVTSNYTYDPIYQLIQASGGNFESFTYDDVGNRLTSGSTPYTYNSSNQLTSVSSGSVTTSFTYDNNGSVLNKALSGKFPSNTTHEWDFENRLGQMQFFTNNFLMKTVEFDYDPFGRRARLGFSSGIDSFYSTLYVYDGANVLDELRPVWGGMGWELQLRARYTHGAGIDEPLAMLRNGVTHYYHADGLGSITSLTDSAGAVAASYRYDSFGKTTVLSGGSITNPFRYTGREFDAETGIYYYRARFYDPSIGRFLSEDPLQFREETNFYSYAGNDPIDLIDPTGLAKCCPKKEEKDIQEAADNARRRLDQLRKHGTALLPTDALRNIGGMTFCVDRFALVRGQKIYLDSFYDIDIREDPKKKPCLYECALKHEMVHARQCQKLGATRFGTLTEAQSEIPAYQTELGCYLKMQMDNKLGPYK